MELTQQDYDERRQRLTDGTATDEDRRLVKHYENQGYGSADPSWLLDDQHEEDGDPDDQHEEDGDPAAGYGALSKRQLQEELGKRKTVDGQPVGFPSTANKATLISLLENNDRMLAEQNQGS